jgi:hypothetical protein
MTRVQPLSDAYVGVGVIVLLILTACGKGEGMLFVSLPALLVGMLLLRNTVSSKWVVPASAGFVMLVIMALLMALR